MFMNIAEDKGSYCHRVVIQNVVKLWGEKNLLGYDVDVERLHALNPDFKPILPVEVVFDLAMSLPSMRNRVRGVEIWSWREGGAGVGGVVLRTY